MRSLRAHVLFPVYVIKATDHFLWRTLTIHLETTPPVVVGLLPLPQASATALPPALYFLCLPPPILTLTCFPSNFGPSVPAPSVLTVLVVASACLVLSAAVYNATKIVEWVKDRQHFPCGLQWDWSWGRFDCAFSYLLFFLKMLFTLRAFMDLTEASKLGTPHEHVFH